MKLTEEQQAVLDGKNGETMAKVMETLVRYGELFKAERMVPVTGKYGHLVTSFGLGVIKPVYGLMDELIDAGIVSKQKFTMDPRPLDPNVPSNLIEDLVFHKFMYSEQKKFKAKMNYADKTGVPYVMFLGEDEIAKGVIACKDMTSGEQTTLDFAGTLARVQEGLAERNRGKVIVEK